MSEAKLQMAEEAEKRFRSGYACSQAVFTTFAEGEGMPADVAARIASAFGGGMGRMGHVCGAVTGAFMMIGLKHGNAAAGDTEAKERTHALVRDHAAQFARRHGTIICRELLGCDLSTPESYKRAKDQGVFVKLCPLFVRDSAAILERMLADDKTGAQAGAADGSGI